MKLQRLPSFIIIGAMKCGTTSLFHYLGQHPELSPCRMKEPAFFARTNRDKGLAWYQSLFRDTHKLQFEASTDYTKYPNFSDVPERMSRLLPDVKLIYIVRHPVERIISHLQHNLVEGRLSQKALAQDDFWEGDGQFYINCSRYYMQIQRYLTHFDLDRLLLLHMEDLGRNPIDVCQKVFAFLELKDRHYIPSVAKRYNTAHQRGRNMLERGLKVLQRTGLISRKTPRTVADTPVLRSEHVSYIWNQLEPDLRRFEELSGAPLPYHIGDAAR